MIAALRFASVCGAGVGPTIRPIAFGWRSTLPLPAVCLVANGMREQLTRLLAGNFELVATQPIIPGPDARAVLFKDAIVYRVEGRLCAAFILLRPPDAKRLMDAAFGEIERSHTQPLSEIERTTLERILLALASLCAPLCGPLGTPTRETAERAEVESITYFEVRTLGALPLAVGFALTRDPPEEITQQVQWDDLLDIELQGRVELARGEISFSSLARLDEGTCVALRTRLEDTGTLRFGDVVVARGTCGVQGSKSTFLVENV